MNNNDINILEDFLFSLEETGIETSVIEYLKDNSSKLDLSYEPIDHSEQEILNNKIQYAFEFLNMRKLDQLSSAEKKHLLQIFKQKY